MIFQMCRNDAALDGFFIELCADKFVSKPTVLRNAQVNEYKASLMIEELKTIKVEEKQQQKNVRVQKSDQESVTLFQRKRSTLYVGGCRALDFKNSMK